VYDAPEFSAVDEFKLIVAAVAREYGDQLAMSASTEYVDIPTDVLAALRDVSSGLNPPDISLLASNAPNIARTVMKPR
jgi:hypothetical protein